MNRCIVLFQVLIQKAEVAREQVYIPRSYAVLSGSMAWNILWLFPQLLYGVHHHQYGKGGNFSFTLVPEEDVIKILVSSPPKTCDLGPIFPTSLVKECADIGKMPITGIINNSLRESSRSAVLKVLMLLPFSSQRFVTHL